MNEAQRERIEELLAVDALGGLDAEGRAELDALLADPDVLVDDVTAERSAYGEAAAALAMSLDPVPVGRTMADGILTYPQADTDLIGADGGYGDDGGDPEADPGDELARMREARRPSRGMRIMAGFVAAAVLLLLGGVGGAILQNRSRGGDDLERFLAQPGTSVSSFSSESGGSLNMATSDETDDMYLFGDKVPSPGSGKVYQLWTITGEDNPVPGPTFETGADGVVMAHVEMPHEGVDVMAITVEPPGGSSAPTTAPTFLAEMA